MSLLGVNAVEALVVSVLAVGGWPAERVRAALPQLRAAGVLQPADVAAMDLGVLTVKLAKHGYSRGLLTSMYAERLQAMMREIAAGQLDDLRAIVASGTVSASPGACARSTASGPRSLRTPGLRWPPSVKDRTVFGATPEGLHRVRTWMRVGGCCSLRVPQVSSHACTSSFAMYSPVAS
jgi:hypothetical protein